MNYLMCKHRVTNYGKWHEVFDSHAEAQRASGLHLLHLLRDTGDPNLVILLFRIDDPEKARAFTKTPNAAEAAERSGVIGVPEVSYLTD